MTETEHEHDQQLAEGQLIMATYRVKQDMTWSEARELIRSNTPSSFSFESGETAAAGAHIPAPGAIETAAE